MILTKETDVLDWVPAGPKHKTYIQRAQEETARTTYGRDATEAEKARWSREFELALQNTSHYIGMLYEADRILGYYWLQKRGPHIAYLLDIFVDPAVRGMGWGDVIFSQVITHALSIGCNEMQWVVARENTAAKKLFERYGNEIETETPHERLVEMHTYIQSI